jgi:hypothetical protein
MPGPYFRIQTRLRFTAGSASQSARRAPVNVNAAATKLKFLLPLVWWIFIARLVHVEALSGDRQFWTTLAALAILVWQARGSVRSLIQSRDRKGAEVVRPLRRLSAAPRQEPAAFPPRASSPPP